MSLDRKAIVREAVIIDAVRSPLGRGRPETGALATIHPVDLLAHVLHSLVDRVGLDAASVDDVIAGCVTQRGEQAVNIARYGTLAAGFPDTVPACTVDRQCGSSQEAVHVAAQRVLAGAASTVIACGVEAMSRVPLGSAASANAHPRTARNIVKRYPDGLVSQGIAAELIATAWEIGRVDLDAFSVESHRRAAAAQKGARFDREIVPVDVVADDAPPTRVDQDEGVRTSTSVEALAALRPAFWSKEMAERFPEIRWVVHAGNSSQISDGASAVLVMERAEAERLGLRPRARIRHATTAGDDPLLMLTAVIPATRRVLDGARLALRDVDVFEVNEAFAPVVLAWHRELGVDLDRVNVNGGAIALGHPVGASGARLMTTMLNVLEQREGTWGLQTMCEGGGMASATIIERLP